MADQTPPRPFRLLRHFGIASLGVILAIAGLVAFGYRAVSINTITEIGEHLNLHLARIALEPFGRDLAAHLSEIEDAEPETATNTPFPDDLATAIRRLLGNESIVRVKVYDRNGVVVYSTKSSQIGDLKSDNRAVRHALDGQRASKLFYRDAFNYFDQETSDDNLIQTYLPVRAGPFDAVVGVFEIYTDVNDLVRHSEQAQRSLLLLVLLLFVILFAAQFFIVWRAEGILERQAIMIADRARMLELLSAQLLSTQEDEKKRIAHALHEEIAQTLAALKLRLELMTRVGDKNGPEATEMAALVRSMRDAIRDTRSLAVRMRPSALDDFGLIPAVEAYLRDLRETNPGIRIETDFSVGDDDLPRPLQTVIFRVLQDTLEGLAGETGADRLLIGLRRTASSVELSICENASRYGPDADSTMIAGPIRLMEERALLSGGEFRRTADKDCGVANVATWLA